MAHLLRAAFVRRNLFLSSFKAVFGIDLVLFSKKNFQNFRWRRPEQRSRREKKLTPALLAFFETKNSTGFFASVAAAQRDQ